MQSVVAQGFDMVVFGNPLSCDSKDGLWARIHDRWFKISTDRQPVPQKYLITPGMIRVGFIGRFGRCETEGFAARLVEYAQERGDWSPFQVEELNSSSSFEHGRAYPDDLEFFVQLGFLVKEGGDNSSIYAFTKGFVKEVLG